MQKILPLFVLLALLNGACSHAGPERPAATLLLVNGTFWTGDSLQPAASALAIRNDRILYVGDDAGARAFAGDSTEIIDLQGAFGMPGLIEGHGHFGGLGRSLLHLNLLQTSSWNEVLEKVREKVAQTPPGDWIEGRGWHQEKWGESPGRTVNGYPYHDALSAIASEHPVVLDHASGHALIANKRAMDLAGISRETPDPVGGRVVRDAAGNLTGVFEENAMELIDKPLRAWKDRRSEADKQADFDRAAALAAQACLERGITSFQDAGSDFWELAQYRRLAESGQLPIRLWAMIAQPRPSQLDRLADFPQIGLGNGHFTVRAVKAYIDGALGSYGAWLLEDYVDKPGHLGQNVTEPDTLKAIAAACHRHGLQYCVHAIGDRANRKALDIFALFVGEEPEKELLRWRIEHAQHIDPADIARFRQLGAVASIQAIHCTSDAPFVVKRLGETRARDGAYPWRSLIDSGAHLANGTDAPVEAVDPMPNLYASVTRKRLDSGLEFFAEQVMTREEALRSLTLWNAWAAFEEAEKGSLSPGKLADVSVFSTDLLRCAVSEIPEAQALYTIVGGKVRFRR